MIRFHRLFRTAIAATSMLFILVTASAAQQRQSDPLYGMLDSVCNAPGYSLSQRLEALEQWRNANNAEMTNVVPALAEAWVRADVVHGRLAQSDAQQAVGARIEGLGQSLQEPVDSNRGATRLVMKKDNAGMALLIGTTQGPGLAILNCRLLLKTPGEALVAELIDRYKTWPVRGAGRVRSWQAQSMFQTPEQAHTHARGLTFLMNGNSVEVAIIEYSFTVQSK